MAIHREYVYHRCSHRCLGWPLSVYMKRFWPTEQELDVDGTGCGGVLFYAFVAFVIWLLIMAGVGVGHVIQWVKVYI